MRGRVRVQRGGPLGPELHVDVLDGVDPEPVDAEVPDPPLVDLLHTPDDLGTLGPQVVQAGEVSVGRGLAGVRRVAPVVVHRRVVEPGRDLAVARDLRRAREGAGVHGRELPAAVRVGGVVEGLPVLGQVREGPLGQVVVRLLLVVHDVGGVVGDDVEEDLHALGVRLGDEGLEVLVRPEVRVDLGEVGDPVAVVAGRGVAARALHRAVLEDRRHPDGGGAEALDVVEPFGQALEVTALVEALVGGVVAGAEPGTGQTAPVVGRVPVGETIRHDEVELVAGVVVPGGLGREFRVRRGRGRGGRPGRERLHEGGCERGDGDGRDPSGMGGTARRRRRPSRYHRRELLAITALLGPTPRRGSAPMPGARATVSLTKGLQQEA